MVSFQEYHLQEISHFRKARFGGCPLCYFDDRGNMLDQIVCNNLPFVDRYGNPSWRYLFDNMPHGKLYFLQKGTDSCREIFLPSQKRSSLSERALDENWGTKVFVNSSEIRF